MSYARMAEPEATLAAEVRHLLSQADATDAQEDAVHGARPGREDVPRERQRRETRTSRIREAKRVLEARATAQADQKPPEEAMPADKAQYNFTDPESRIMKGPDGFVQAYDAQIAVESVCQLIVGQAVTQDANDKRQLTPIITAVVEQFGERPTQVLADSGYCSEANLTTADVDLFLASGRLAHGEPPPCPRGPLPKGATLTDRMRRR